MVAPVSPLSWFTGWHVVMLAGGLGLLFGAVLGEKAIVGHIQQDAIARTLLAHDDSLISKYQMAADSFAVIVKTDTLRLTQREEHYTTLHDTVERHLTDTVLVKEFVEQADTTIKACKRVVLDCTQEVTALRAELTAATDANAQEARLMPTFVQRHVGWVAGVVGVAGLILGHAIR